MKNIVNLIAILAISTLLASCSKDISNNTVEITQSFIDSIRQYDKLYPFSEGFAPVVKDGKWGYINNKGEAVIPCQFSSNAEPFVGGYAKVDNSYYINTKGEKVNLSEAEINARTSLDVDSISLVRFERNGKVGYMTKDSVVVVQPKYHILGSFHNGVAIAVLTNSAVDKNGDDYELVGRAQDWVDDGGEWAKKMHDIYDEVLIYGYVDTKGNDTFKDDDFSLVEEKIAKRNDEDKRQKEEDERILKEGPDWLQGTWRVEMTDDYGNFIGYMYNTFDHGNLTIKTGDMVFDYTYTLSPDHRFVEFGDGGKYMLGEETVMTNTGDQMEKISDLSSSPSNSSESNYNNSQSNAERNIMAKLHQLNEKAKQKMPRIEALYRRQQQAQRQGILSNPNAQFDLNDAINEIIDIKNEQIRLAEQLGDAQLVREYKDQRNKIYEAKDKMLYGR